MLALYFLVIRLLPDLIIKSRLERYNLPRNLQMLSCYLPYERFESCARELVDLSHELGDGWELKTVQICSEPARIFLTKTVNHTIEAHIASISSDDVLLDLAGPSQVEDGVTDPAIVNPTQSPQTVTVEYHIVFSESYEVPILYFNARQLNGQQLVLDDIWKIVSKTLTSSGTDRWSLISQQEHPLLCRPFYHIHPCHTAKVMGKALTVTSHSNSVSSSASVNSSPSSTSVNYLISWLSVFGPLVGLSVPLAYINRPEE